MSLLKSTSPAASGPILLAGCMLVVAGVVAYHNSLSGPFVFDDAGVILDNPSIRHLWPPWEALSPPHDNGISVNGRPLVNLSLAFNYALGGTAVWGYHVFNLVIHLLAGLALFGVIRRTLSLPSLPERFGRAALPLAFTAALLWILHPLQTESVTYVTQRAEALMGLFYLFTVYAFIRGGESHILRDITPAHRSRLWFGAAVAACLLGMATKEVMASAPLIVLLYDRTFLAGSFRATWRQRGKIHLLLAATWLLLGWLMIGSGGRGGTSGFGISVSARTYALTQAKAIVHYLSLSAWPHPLVLDYGTVWIREVTQAAPYLLVVIALVGGTLLALWRRPKLGFLGAWFLAILAPSSSIVPIADAMFEHRMYLSLAAVIVAGVVAAHHWFGTRGLILGLVLSGAFAGLTHARNEDYRSELALWSRTVATRPGNSRAHNNLGFALTQAGRTQDGVGEYLLALQLDSANAQAHNNLGNALMRLGRTAEAIGEYEQALRLKADYPSAHSNLGFALLQSGNIPDARRHLEEALRLKPHLAGAHYNLGLVLLELRDTSAAMAELQTALQLQPGLTSARDLLTRLQTVTTSPSSP